MKENQHIEWKETWRDEYIKWICGFANAMGGTLVIGKNNKGIVTGVDHAEKLMMDIPNKVRDILGIIVDVNLKSARGKDFLEILVEPYPYPVSYKGEYHYRSGSTRQELKGAALDKFLLQKQGKRWDSVPVPQVGVADFRSDSFELFRTKAAKSGRMSDEVLGDSNKALPENWTVKQLQEKHPSKPYNPLIANTFFRTGLIEAWGRGIEKIHNECKLAGIPAPEINYDFAGLMLTFQSGTKGKTQVETQVEKKAKTPELILQILSAHPEMSLIEVAEITGKSLSAVERATSKLVREGSLRHVGPKKGGYWKVQGNTHE